MADRVELGFRRAALKLIADHTTVLAAVSGGGDSVALLHLLLGYARGRGLSIQVAHLDHGLRRGSAADRRFVERLTKTLRLPVVSDRREVPRLRRRDESPEEAARRVRRGFLLSAREQTGADLIVTGHTLDDQAETVVMRLVRGGGTRALGGMAEAGPGPFVRPLLRLERSDLREYLDRHGHDFRDDPTNHDLSHDRNRVRRRVLPMLTDTLNPRAARNLVAAADRLREEADYLDQQARRWFQRLSQVGRGNRVKLDAAGLGRAPSPIASRVVVTALHRVGADPRRVSTRHIDAVLALATGPGGKVRQLTDGVTARRRGAVVVLER